MLLPAIVVTVRNAIPTNVEVGVLQRRKKAGWDELRWNGMGYPPFLEEERAQLLHQVFPRRRALACSTAFSAREVPALKRSSSSRTGRS